MGLTQGLLATLVAHSAPPELKGTAFGLFNLISGVAMLIASVVAVELWERADASTTLLIVSANSFAMQNPARRKTKLAGRT